MGCPWDFGFGVLEPSELLMEFGQQHASQRKVWLLDSELNFVLMEFRSFLSIRMLTMPRGINATLTMKLTYEKYDISTNQ